MSAIDAAHASEAAADACDAFAASLGTYERAAEAARAALEGEAATLRRDHATGTMLLSAAAAAYTATMRDR